MLEPPVDLPAANQPVNAPAGSAAAGAVIFAVDDDENDRLLLSRALATAGIAHPCRMFTTGAEMLDALIGVLRGAPPPLVCLVDVKMAGVSGFDVLRWIRAQSALHAVPVVMLSSSDAPSFVEESHQVGAQCYVTKFPPPEQWREIIAAADRFVTASAAGAAFPLPCNLLAACERQPA